jgi:RNA-binding protein PNO1
LPLLPQSLEASLPYPARWKNRTYTLVTFAMPASTSASKVAHSSTSKPSSAKSALLGSKSQVAESSSAASLPTRAPFGQEDDEDDDDDDVMYTLSAPAQGDDDDDEVMIDDVVALVPVKEAANGKSTSSATKEANLTSIDPTLKPTFKPLSKGAAQSAQDALDVTRGQLRKIPIPPHRMTPLKNEWPKIYTPLVEMAGLQVRMNVKRKSVEIKVSTLQCLNT